VWSNCTIQAPHIEITTFITTMSNRPSVNLAITHNNIMNIQTNSIGVGSGLSLLLGLFLDKFFPGNTAGRRPSLIVTTKCPKFRFSTEIWSRSDTGYKTLAKSCFKSTESFHVSSATSSRVRAHLGFLKSRSLFRGSYDRGAYLPKLKLSRVFFLLF